MTGINAKAIRYYESIGLLPRPQRGDNSYRRYGIVDVNRLLLFRRIRQRGVPQLLYCLKKSQITAFASITCVVYPSTGTAPAPGQV